MTNYWPVTSSSKYRACPIMSIMDSDKCFLAFLPPISCFFSIFHFGKDNVNWNTIWIFIYSHALMAACVQEIVYIDCGFGADPYPILFSSPWFKSYLQQRGSSNKNDCQYGRKSNIYPSWIVPSSNIKFKWNVLFKWNLVAAVWCHKPNESEENGL